MLKRLKVFSVAAVAMLAMAATASAAPIVTFTTTGIFGSSGSNIATFGSGPGGTGTATVTFNGIAAGNSFDLVNGLSNVSYGDFVLTTTGGNFSGTASSSFTLGISQTEPSAGTSAFVGTLTGSFVIAGTPGSTDFSIAFNPTMTTIGGVTYVIDPLYRLVPPTSGVGGGATPGTTSIQGEIRAANPIPEPTTMMLLGTGLLAAFRARRRKA